MFAVERDDQQGWSGHSHWATTGQPLGKHWVYLRLDWTPTDTQKLTLTEVFECYSRLQNLDSPVFILIRVSSLTGGNARYHQGDNVRQLLVNIPLSEEIRTQQAISS